jgi:hypothetical protein
MSDEGLAVACAARDAEIRRFRSMIETVEDPEVRAKLEKMLEGDLEDQRRNPPPR